MVSAVAAAVLIASGMATRYDPGVMQKTVANRILWGQLPSDADPARCVAMIDCDLIGEQVWLETANNIYGPYTVADCAAKQDVARLANQRFAVDLSYELAKELGLPIYDVKVWDADPHPDKRLGRRCREAK